PGPRPVGRPRHPRQPLVRVAPGEAVPPADRVLRAVRGARLLGQGPRPLPGPAATPVRRRRGLARPAHRGAALRGAGPVARHHHGRPPALPRAGQRRGGGLMGPPEVWAVDTEWGYRNGRVGWESAWEPVVLCLVGTRSGHRLSF